MLHGHILTSPDGFEIKSHSREYLTIVGSRIFLRYIGYNNHLNISSCIKNNPQNIQECVEACALFYKHALLNFDHLTNLDLEVFISQLLFEKTTKFSLMIVIPPKNQIFVRKIFCKTLDEFC